MLRKMFKISLIVITVLLVILLDFEITFLTTKPSSSREYSSVPNAYTYYKNVFDFLKNNQKLSSDFPIKQKEHFYDVRNLLCEVKWIILILLTLELVFLLVLLYKDKNNFFNDISFVLSKSFFSAILVIVLFLIALVNFDRAFLLFHKLLFPQGNYFFDENSLIIRLFPEIFFVNFFERYLRNLFLFSSILFLIKFFCCKKQKIFKAE